MENIIFYM